MRDDALRRAIGAAVVITAAALLIGNGIIGSTGAVFNAETKNNASAFAGGWVGAPTAATATTSGYDGILNWTPGTQSVTGQTINVADNGTSSNCTGAAYGSPATVSATTNARTDANRAASANGDWFCYQIVSTSATVWTSVLNLPAVQLGLAATNVAIANGGTANSIDGGDTITITFNQQTTIANSSTLKVCAFGGGSNTILLGDGKTGNNCGSAATDGYTIGQLTTTSTISGSSTRYTNSSVSVSTSAPWTVTITLSNNGSTTVASGANWTFTPSASVATNVATDRAPACTSPAATCQPTTSTSF